MGVCRVYWTKPHLYSAVAPVSYNDVPVCVHGHSRGSVELAVAFAVGAKLEQELPVCVVNLERDITLDGRKPNTASTRRNLRELLYLHRVIVKIRHDDFVLVVHRDKVRTWSRKEMNEAQRGGKAHSCSSFVLLVG